MRSARDPTWVLGPEAIRSEPNNAALRLSVIRQNEDVMKNLVSTLFVPMVLVAAPAFAATEDAGTCSEKFEEMSSAWSEYKTGTEDVDSVTLDTEEGEVDVAAKDAEPTENWFGKPPNAETIEGYLTAAEEAMNAGDEKACMEQLQNVEDAMSDGEDEKSDS